MLRTSRVSIRAFALSALALSLQLITTACSESAASGELVAIPQVIVDCTTALCKNPPNGNSSPVIFVAYTTGPCTSVFGYARSSSVNNITCNLSTGCRGEVTPWVDAANQATTQIPSGTYNLCAFINFDPSNPFPDPGDVAALRENIAVGASTGPQFISNFADVP